LIWKCLPVFIEKVTCIIEGFISEKDSFLSEKDS
jgi:hypothetical protein